jgi:hypothetical protein
MRALQFALEDHIALVSQDYHTPRADVMSADLFAFSQAESCTVSITPVSGVQSCYIHVMRYKDCGIFIYVGVSSQHSLLPDLGILTINYIVL